MNRDVSREHEGDWKWSDLSNGYVYKHWDQNEPDGGDMENCAFMHMETGAWRDTNCLDKHTFICKVSQQCSDWLTLLYSDMFRGSPMTIQMVARVIPPLPGVILLAVDMRECGERTPTLGCVTRYVICHGGCMMTSVAMCTITR